jgi:hypothetical protein
MEKLKKENEMKSVKMRERKNERKSEKLIKVNKRKSEREKNPKSSKRELKGK